MKSILSIFFGLIFIVNTCDFSNSDEDNNDDDTISSDIKISVDEEFQISMESNPTTGYSWVWTNSKSVSIVDSVSYEYVVDTPTLAGTGGTDYWTFKGIEKGYDSLVFEYCRTWDENSTIKTQTFTVNVN